jgi:hypothetical protein
MVLLLLAIVLSVLLRYTESDYPFGIFKLFILGYLVKFRLKWHIIIYIYHGLYRVMLTVNMINSCYTQTPLKTGDEIWCFGRVSSSCSTSDTCHVNLFSIKTNSVANDNHFNIYWYIYHGLYRVMLTVNMINSCYRLERKHNTQHHGDNGLKIVQI